MKNIQSLRVSEGLLLVVVLYAPVFVRNIIDWFIKGPKGWGMRKRDLLLGCGSNREKKLFLLPECSDWGDLTTLDINPDHHPDIEWDLNNIPLPFSANEFDSIHLYDVLEHTGKQGDAAFFFAQFSDFWRILKPGGLLHAICPSPKSVWAWADPSHTRVICLESLVFLSQKQYKKQVGITPMSDFRNIYKADFEQVYGQDDGERCVFVLKAIK